MWILILIAVNIHNPNDIPGQIVLSFDTEQECLKAEQSVEWNLKFKNFKVESKCEKH